MTTQTSYAISMTTPDGAHVELFWNPSSGGPCATLRVTHGGVTATAQLPPSLLPLLCDGATFAFDAAIAHVGEFAK